MLKHSYRTPRPAVEPGASPKRRRHGDRGATLVEYALMVALVAVVCIGAVSLLGRKVEGSTVEAAGCRDGFHAVAQDGSYSNTNGGGVNYTCVPN